MGLLGNRIKELIVTRFLRFGKGAVLKITNADGTESTVDLTELAALDNIAAADLAKIDGITNGTVAAGKAAVVDANKDIGDFRNLDAVNIDAGASGTAGSVDVFPTTAAKGKLIISCTDQTGDTTVTLKPAAMGQATVVTIPDPGAATSYVAQSTAALSLAEVDVLNGATAGTQVASKAVVADANINTGISKITELHIGASGAETQVTSTAAEINYLDLTTGPGTQEASKAVVADANVNTGVSKVTELHIGASGAETQVNATAAEINQNCDLSANSETVDTAAAISVTKSYTAIDNTTGGAGAVTLAAPDATMLGKVKTIEMTVDGGDITLSLANVQGGTAATTATFADVSDTLVLVGGAAKWHVIGESGVVLS